MEKTKGKSEIAFVRSLFPSESLISPVKRSVQLLSGAAAAVLQSEFEVATPLSVMLTAEDQGKRKKVSPFIRLLGTVQ